MRAKKEWLFMWWHDAIAVVEEHRVRVWVHNPSPLFIAIPSYLLLLGLFYGCEYGRSVVGPVATAPFTFISHHWWTLLFVPLVWLMRVTTVRLDASEAVIRHYTGIRVWEERHPIKGFTFPYAYNNQDERNWDQGGYEDTPHIINKPPRSLITRRIRHGQQFIEWIDEQAHRLEGRVKSP